MRERERQRVSLFEALFQCGWHNKYVTLTYRKKEISSLKSWPILWPRFLSLILNSMTKLSYKIEVRDNHYFIMRELPRSIKNSDALFVCMNSVLKKNSKPTIFFIGPKEKYENVEAPFNPFFFVLS